MATPPKPWKAEYAKSGRSSCNTCKSPISKETFRLGKMVQATQFDGFRPMWHHASCVLKKANLIKFIDDVEGMDSLRWEDQQDIRQYVEGGGPSNAEAVTAMENVIEVSQTSRATSKLCSQKIMKGQVLISSKPDEPQARELNWHHATCFMDLNPSVLMEKQPGWENLTTPDQTAVLALVKEASSAGKGSFEGRDKEQEPAPKAGAKCRKDDDHRDQNPKVARVGEMSTSSTASMKNGNEWERKLEAQSKQLWALKDDLKKNVTTAELRQMLEINGQDSSGSELVLRDRCADGMMFGALDLCPMCHGFLHCSGGTYRCSGHLTEWSKCAYSTHKPRRLKGEWKVREDTDNEYLSRWFKSQKGNKPDREVLPASPVNPSGSQAANSSSLFKE